MTEEKRKPGRPKRENTPERPARVPLDRQSQLQAPPGLDWDNFVYRWCRDDGVGSIDAYQAAYWEFHEGLNGRYIRPAGDGTSLILMKLPIEYHIEDQKLQEARNIDTLASQTTMEEGDYIPNGRKFVVSSDV